MTTIINTKAFFITLANVMLRVSATAAPARYSDTEQVKEYVRLDSSCESSIQEALRSALDCAVNRETKISTYTTGTQQQLWKKENDNLFQWPEVAFPCPFPKPSYES